MSQLTYAMGDVHGRHDLLAQLLERVAAHAKGRPHKLVFLGDYIDRGPSSAAAIETVRSLQAKAPDGVVCLMGNHEAMLLAAAADPSLEPWWRSNGGTATLESYGVGTAREVPSDVLGWLRTLPTMHEDDLRYYVHAGLHPEKSMDQQTDQDRIWIREPFISVEHDFGKHVVHGHTPLRSSCPDARLYRTNLDTGAVFGGVLTAGIFSDRRAPAIGFLSAPPLIGPQGRAKGSPQALA